MIDIEKLREASAEKIAEALGDAYDCTRNGMDAPTRNGIECAKVVVLFDHLNREERPP